MDRVLVSRQPIYGADMAVFGYELLFRDSEINRASFSDGDQATAEVMVGTTWSLPILYGVILLVLVFRPQGLMGTTSEARL